MHVCSDVVQSSQLNHLCHGYRDEASCDLFSQPVVDSIPSFALPWETLFSMEVSPLRALCAIVSSAEPRRQHTQSCVTQKTYPLAVILI